MSITLVNAQPTAVATQTADAVWTLIRFADKFTLVKGTSVVAQLSTEDSADIATATTVVVAETRERKAHTKRVAFRMAPRPDGVPPDGGWVQLSVPAEHPLAKAPIGYWNPKDFGFQLRVDPVAAKSLDEAIAMALAKQAVPTSGGHARQRRRR